MSVNLKLKHKIFFYINTRNYTSAVLVILCLLILNMIIQLFFSSLLICIIYFLLSIGLVLLIVETDYYIHKNWMPKKVMVESMIRTFNINYLNSDIKLDIYHKYIFKDLKKIFKLAYITKDKNRNRISCIFSYDGTEFEFIGDDLTITHAFPGGYSRVDILMFSKKYNITSNEMDKLFEYYIKKFMI